MQIQSYIKCIIESGKNIKKWLHRIQVSSNKNQARIYSTKLATYWIDFQARLLACGHGQTPRCDFNVNI